ncbi:putative uncharacterized protein DDB_G0277255 isoform X2 [Condylostylus longicornis]|uniref:putative uncharacterized protein DDB_G0277255 isoform X2 n=1 Tax=Condylostylus longicornis TaxID=2530218 RepID=UPI00244DC0D2|nr:putative uncharacterized protein DDB_G0277255 isoform X2 [Condylostylus longicornis]
MEMFHFLIAIVLEIGISHLDYVNAHRIIKDNSNIDPSEEFISHSIIKPQLFHGKHKNSIKSTLVEEDGLHTSHITLSYHHNGENVIADLYLNDNLLPQEHFLRFQDSNGGSDIIKNFSKTEIELCHYQGNIRGKFDSRIAVSTCNGGINGIVLDGSDTYFIHSTPDGQIHDDHFIFKHSDIKKNATCGYQDDNGQNLLREDLIRLMGDINNLNDTSNQLSNSIETNNRILRYKRSSESEIHGPYNANKYSSFVELVIVVDNKVYQSFGENLKKVHNHCKDLANIVNALYVPLNIFIALVGVVVWSEQNEIVLSEDGDVTLKNFLIYRKTKLIIDHPNDNAQLLTKEQFSGGVVGKALKGPICTFEYSGGVSMEHSTVVGVVATTVAHEMGHNFGMEHDTADCKCEEEKCIMSASSTSVVPRHWSSCSKDQLNVAFSRGMNYCLRNKPTKLFDSPQCGNGFVEVGEQCDCGLPKYCQNTCCDPNTCMLYANASCATGECCDLTTCRPKAAGIKCRSAQSECDLPEYCTGEAEYCPTDVYKRDAIECDNGNAYCYQGTCRSRTAQCKILWGPSGQSSDYCYDKNTDGSRHGNCGFDRLGNKYIPCRKEDVRCGMLHCKHLNERLEFGMESVAVLSHSFMNHKGNIIPCRTAVVDLGLESIDPGLTPNGAKCGDNKMCVNQKCVSIDNFRIQGRGIACPENCNGNGVCNSKGNCHCFVGFSPPYCNSPGYGGSHDSGPATNPNSNVGFTRTMYIFFLGVVPFVSIFLFLMYYWKQNKSFDGLRKSANVLKPVIKMNPSRNDGSGSPNSPCGGMATSSPSSTDDMNSALLKSPTENNSSSLKFGKYKGFTLAPLPYSNTNHEGPKVAFVHPVSKSAMIDDLTSASGAPLRHAPPVPKQSPLMTRDKGSPILNKMTTLDRTKKSLQTILDKNNSNLKCNEKIDAPALPPPNPGFSARPLISNPVLEASTCTAKEISDDRMLIPTRPAPIAPPTSNTPDPNKFQIKSKEGTIKRIASFLKKEEKSDIPYKIRPKIDRERLKTIEISAPISVDETLSSVSIKNDGEEKNKLNRTQSMRSPKSETLPSGIVSTHLQSAGSTRSVNRPKSIVGNNRPKSPPPRPPAPLLSTYNVPQPTNLVNKIRENEYDDCEAIENSLNTQQGTDYNTSADEIYSVIDEYSPPVPSISNNNAKKNTDLLEEDVVDNNSSMGLLGEIVNEIEKRNVDSIYSASTLKKSKSIESPSISSYANNSESQYGAEPKGQLKSNGNNSIKNSGTNNAPIARIAPNRTTETSKVTSTNSSGNYGANSFSSFKQSKLNAKPSASSANSSNVKVGTQIISNNVNQGKQGGISKRSPSPSTNSKNSNVNKPVTKIKTVSSPKSTRKSSIDENKPSSSNDINILKQNAGNSSQKPKVLSKPASISSVHKSNISGRSLNKQNSVPSSNDNITKSLSGAKLQSFAPTLSRNNSSAKTSDNLDSNNTSNSNSSNNKIGFTNKPVPGKTVSSLQQKFENKNKSENSSSSVNKK